MNQADVVQVFSEVTLKTALDSAELGKIEDMLKHPGFKLYAGLLLGSRQALLMALANTPLGTAEKSAQASVLQGKVHGLDLALETIVELFTPAEKDLN